MKSGENSDKVGFDGVPRVRDPRRARWQSRVPRYYSPELHLLGNLAVVVGISLWLIGRLGETAMPWWAWTAIPAGLVFANFVEYLLHRYPMHKRYAATAHVFVQHTLRHHRFYTEKQMEAEGRRDLFFVIFQVQFGLFSLAVSAFMFFLARWVVNPEYATLLAITLMAYVLMLDGVHLMTHLPERLFARGRIFGWGPWPYLMRLHKIHHNPRRMRDVNFNITFPLADWIMGTLDDGRAMRPEHGALPSLQRLFRRFSEALASRIGSANT